MKTRKEKITDSGEKSVLIRYEIMIDEATESWEVVKASSNNQMKKHFYDFFKLARKDEKRFFLLTFCFEPIIYCFTSKNKPRSVKKAAQIKPRFAKANSSPPD